MAVEYPKHPFLLTISETVDILGTDVEEGLLSNQVAELQRTYPPNELDVGGGVAWYTILSKQLLNAMILVWSIVPQSSTQPLRS